MNLGHKFFHTRYFQKVQSLIEGAYCKYFCSDRTIYGLGVLCALFVVIHCRCVIVFYYIQTPFEKYYKKNRALRSNYYIWILWYYYHIGKNILVSVQCKCVFLLFLRVADHSKKTWWCDWRILWCFLTIFPI